MAIPIAALVVGSFGRSGRSSFAVWMSGSSRTWSRRSTPVLGVDNESAWPAAKRCGASRAWGIPRLSRRPSPTCIEERVSPGPPASLPFRSVPPVGQGQDEFPRHRYRLRRHSVELASGAPPCRELRERFMAPGILPAAYALAPGCVQNCAPGFWRLPLMNRETGDPSVPETSVAPWHVIRVTSSRQATKQHRVATDKVVSSRP